MNQLKQQNDQSQQDNHSQQGSQKRERSREKQPRNRNDDFQTKNNYKPQKQNYSPNYPLQKLKAGQMHYHEYIQKQEQFHQNQQVLRSFLRIEQGRQEPIDKFVKILYIYKGKYQYDPRLHDLMIEPKKYLNKLTIQQLENMLVPTARHLTSEQKTQNKKFLPYWTNLIKLIEYKLQKKKQKQQQLMNEQVQQNLERQNFEIKQKIKTMLNKSEQDLRKLQRKIEIMLKNTNMDLSYWQKVKMKITGKLIQSELKRFYQQYKQHHRQQIQNLQQFQQQQDIDVQPVSPILQAFASINPKLITTQAFELQERLKLSENIFREQFQKHKERLEDNLSLPKNHNLLSKQLVTESSKTYDLITQEIMEFQKYKRMEEDQEQFDDWVPVETEGRFRDRKPQYINRVRISYDWTRYGQSGIIKQKYDQKQPPPKQIQGYKFNVFYPDLFDKQKTPQYYLQAVEDPNYMLIKFKAGPPYKDVAFKILRKEWDFTQKSGFEAIFTKGILQLYFNFKKPKYRI